MTVEVLANDTDPESDIDPWSVRIVAPGALGAATANSPRPGAITHNSAATGIDVMIYQACDRFRQCVTQEVVVTVFEDG